MTDSSYLPPSFEVAVEASGLELTLAENHSSVFLGHQRALGRRLPKAAGEVSYQQIPVSRLKKDLERLSGNLDSSNFGTHFYCCFAFDVFHP
jgi:hypothetical protein